MPIASGFVVSYLYIYTGMRPWVMVCDMSLDFDIAHEKCDINLEHAWGVLMLSRDGFYMMILISGIELLLRFFDKIL